MNKSKNIFAIIGSASPDSANQKIVRFLVGQAAGIYTWTIYEDLKNLPHFDPASSINNPPPAVVALRNGIAAADGILICTPEYIFSIPAGLKNALEWCVAATVFSGKPTGLITASASGQKGHEELQLIMKTLMARFIDETMLLIPGAKGKVNESGAITDAVTRQRMGYFWNAFQTLVLEAGA